MSTLINDPTVQPDIDAIIARRQEMDGDRYDEVWEGVYFMAPMANDEHQKLVMRLAYIVEDTIGITGDAEVRAGVNVSDREENWKENYRVPDVVVFLKNTQAKNCGAFWLGGPDFAIEVTSPYDRSHEKLPFYNDVGVNEVLIVNRQPWQLELYRREDDELKEIRIATVQNKLVIGSNIVPLTFQLTFGEDRPQIEVRRVVAGKEEQLWVV